MASFVARDFETLCQRYRIRRWFYRGSLHGLLDRAVILSSVLSSDFNVSWFGYHQAYWAVRYSRRFGRKSLVILGGFDVCGEEDPNLPARVGEVRYILRNADRILAVSNRVREKARSIEPDARVDLVYHGFDSGTYRPSGEKKEIVTTVAFVKRANLRRKGLDTFVRSAAFMPEYRFLLVGEWLDDAIDHLRSIATKNVSFTGRVSETELVRIFQESAVYVQASMHEGFGCSLAEAMLCGCVPVVSDKGAIPEVVGNAGIYIDPTDARDATRGIRTAMTTPRLAAAARTRIATLFPAERRQERFLSIIEDLLA
jgi:glycosyltransferase involved in cell wall biosynthesis